MTYFFDGEGENTGDDTAAPMPDATPAEPAMPAAEPEATPVAPEMPAEGGSEEGGEENAGA